MNTPAQRLRATTILLPEPPDLLAQAGEDGLLFREENGGLAGRGQALRIDLPGLWDTDAVAEASAVLAEIETDDPVGRPGTGPVAIGALPFDPTAPGHLIVPRRIFGRDGDVGWLTTVEPYDAGPSPVDVGPDPVAPADPPDEFRLTPTMTHADWKDVIAAAVETLDRGDLDKVVLARRIDIEGNRPFVVSDVLERLAALYPSCMVYSVEGFLGASPELLIRRHGDQIVSHPLAGTVARSGDAHGDELLVARLMESTKIRHEHRLVVDAIAASLEPLSESLSVPETPSVLGLRNVSHLATHITGRLGRERPSALELAARLHPTPAVGGAPTEAARHYMQKVEGFDRGRYAGPVGWIDGRGDGCFALGIRCAQVSGDHASLYAGNGIVRGSDPADELAETQLKLQALLAALVRP
ncbi:MAG TPA: isochorismate synthase [Acidimicrobiales bacterium]|jgi:menaquinone-specific isochorismate synthase|nr:isochorismate synthase [Acidimicrobiales bacterium]